MTFQPTHRRTARRVTAALASAAAVGAVLAACSPGEEPSSTPGTTPPVITGDQAPGGLGEGESANGPSGSAAESGQSESGSALSASLISPSGTQVGTARFTSAEGGVRVDVTVTSGITPGFHGMHIHAVGKCENNSTAPTGGAPGAFLSAGGHLQVNGRTGHPSSGDLVSIQVDQNGRGETVTTTDAVTLSDITGKAIIIHSGPDNFANIPTRYAPAPDSETLSTGDAGSRVACGVIEQG